jgi:very-short-patch-repair endonuclease
MSHKYTIEQVRDAFEKAGYVLFSKEYKDAHSKLEYECNWHHTHEIRWSDFRRGERCPSCSPSRKKTIEEIRKVFEERGCTLLSNVYTNNCTKLDYLCHNGHEHQITWRDFQSKRKYNGCPYCAQTKPPTIEEVRLFFEQKECKLLSTEYINAHSNLQYVCPKEHARCTTWTNFYHLEEGCGLCNERKNQKKLGEILRSIFFDEVRPEDNLEFLGLQRVDFSVRVFNLAFEYDGAQHYKVVKWFGGEVGLLYRQELDRRKENLCKERGYTLIRVVYNEELSVEIIKEKLSQSNINLSIIPNYVG